MADISDVERAMVTVATAALYPLGISAPSAVQSACRIGRGWPQPVALNADLKAGTVNVSVCPRPGMARLTTRYQDRWTYTQPAAPTLIATVAGRTVTLSGTPVAGQLAGIEYGATQAAYLVLAGDTLTAVAAALAALVPGATVTGAVVTAPGAVRLVARVMQRVTATIETRRQLQAFQITVWAPTPDLRDQAAALIDGAMSVVRFLPLPDGTTAGPLLYTGSASNDAPGRELLYRRDLMFQAEYPTTDAKTPAQMLFGRAPFTSSF